MTGAQNNDIMHEIRIKNPSKDQNEHSEISKMFITESHFLYVVIETRSNLSLHQINLSDLSKIKNRGSSISK